MSTHPFYVSIPGVCPPAPRPRARIMGQGKKTFASIYTPQSGPYAKWKKHAALWFKDATARYQAAHGEAWVTDAGPVEVRVLFVMPLPTSKMRKTLHIPRAWCQSASRGDADNLAKGPLDAANGILWSDDRDVVSLWVEKIVGEQGEPPRTEMIATRVIRSAERTDFEIHRDQLRDIALIPDQLIQKGATWQTQTTSDLFQLSK